MDPFEEQRAREVQLPDPRRERRLWSAVLVTVAILSVLGALRVYVTSDSYYRARHGGCGLGERPHIVARVPETERSEPQIAAQQVLSDRPLPAAFDGTLSTGSDGEYPGPYAYIFHFGLTDAPTSDIEEALARVRAIEDFEGAQLDVCGRDLLRRKERENSI